MCAAADEVGGKLVFFVDACGAYAQLDQVAEAVRWLDGAGHDVQLHAHPEYLPEAFDQTRYLGPLHVINTLQDVLKVPGDRRFTFGRGGPVVPSIAGLI
jgi:hypothetical protein